MQLPLREQPKGFTLVEAMITSLLAMLLILSICAGVVYNLRVKEVTREYTCTTRLLSQMIEEVRFVRFSDLRQRTAIAVIDDNGTADKGDDLYGTATLSLFLPAADGSLTQITEVPSTGEMLVVRAEVVWKSQNKERKNSMVAQFSRITSDAGADGNGVSDTPGGDGVPDEEEI